MGTLSTMPFYPPRQIVEFEIDAQGANYDSIAKGAKKICADYKKCELHLKFFNLSPVYDVGESQESKAEPKKSEMACNSHIDKTTELKPCLSCGSKDVELVTANPPANPPRIQCNGCDSVFQLVDNSSIDNLVQHWNTRTADESKSKTACNCCAECAEEIDAMEEMNRAVDMFIKAANKLANK